MTFQHGGHGCAGVAGVLGGFGIHLPDKDHDDSEHRNTIHDRINDVRDRVHDHIGGGSGSGDRVGDVRERVQDHFGGGSSGSGSVRDTVTQHAGDSLGLPQDPLNLIFGDPTLAAGDQFSLAAIPVGGGVTMSIVALLAVVCMVVILASMLAKTVMVRCSE